MAAGEPADNDPTYANAGFHQSKTANLARWPVTANACQMISKMLLLMSINGRM